MKGYRHGGGLAAWSIRHPIGVSVLALAVVVLGLFALGRLSVDLLPRLIYPEIRVRIVDPGVPARVMEDRVARQIEEQLAVTEDAINVQTRSTEGSTSLDLSFEYGKDIEVALRDASTRLDRARRFLPDTIQPPTIFKRDPSQAPVAEFVVSSEFRDAVALREWVDYDFAKQFLNLPGVAAVEVGGGLLREVQVLPDPQRLAALGLSLDDLVTALQRGNSETPIGRLLMPGRELAGRATGRFTSAEDVRALPLLLRDGTPVSLREVAQVNDTHAEQRLLVRLDGVPGVKLSIQKQPSANTVAVVDAVNARLAWLAEQALVPEDVVVRPVADQAVYVRNALNNAGAAALSGTLLAMAVVYLFLGDLRRTLLIGTAIPLAVMVTFVIMGLGGLTLNIMTLGGLALGVGMLVDNTIVMLENIYRHQRLGERGEEAGSAAAAEINSAIVASTSTNLAAVLPFLFIGGLVGLLYRELIFTISAAILASMVVALTLVPALGVRVQSAGARAALVDRPLAWLEQRYGIFVAWVLAHARVQAALIAFAVVALVASTSVFFSGKQEFLPSVDDGQVVMSVTADPGIALEVMDRRVAELEALLRDDPDVASVFSTVGGFIFGRSEFESSNRSSLNVALVPRGERSMSMAEWIGRMQTTIGEQGYAGFQIQLRARGLRGIRISRGDDEISLRIQGPDLDGLATVADELVFALRDVTGLRNLRHSAEERRQELLINVDRARAAALGLDPEAIGRALRRALDGEVVTELLHGDRSIDVRLRLSRDQMMTPVALEQIIVHTGTSGRTVRLRDVAQVALAASPAEILREGQRRIVEISANLNEGATLGEVHGQISERLAQLQLPDGYALYDGGGLATLQQGQAMGMRLLALAIFLVFVVMAVQYESVRNPLVILCSVPFAVIGVALSLVITGLPLSMPVWLGLIMLAGIVVNNAIVLVEYVELARGRGVAQDQALVEAARLRLRPILMTTLTTVMGLLPLAIGLGEGAEMLKPLAVAMVGGLTLSLFVTLLLIPIIYRGFHWRDRSPKPRIEVIA